MARRGDRASMREGPLAALFRKTEDDEPQETEPVQERAPEPPPAAPPAPATPAGQANVEAARPHPSLTQPSPAEPEEEPRIPSPQETEKMVA